MRAESRTPKAVALISGGLDSMLAARLVMDQGVHVEGLNFYTGFCVEGHTHAIRQRERGTPKRNNALWVCEQLGIRLNMIDVVEPYKSVVLNPRHGYGANLNPCLDCKIFMVSRARHWIAEHDFDFIVTGEVIGQRPMSQRRETMPVVENESGAQDVLLRPLSARHLPPTLPEREGWVDRERLLDITGRSRKPQIRLAESLGIKDYAQPAGGCCFLTDPNYTGKLRDLWAHRKERDYELDDIILLKVGRHLRPRSHFKIIVARDDGENRFMSGYRRHFAHLHPVSHGGPLALLEGDGITDAEFELAARIVARFSQGRDAAEVEVAITPLGQNSRHTSVQPMDASAVPSSWYL